MTRFACFAAALALCLPGCSTNWDIKHTKVDDTRYRIEMRKNLISTGGDGEAIDLFHRYAGEISAQALWPAYTILSWNEGVESEFPIARRWARGEIELVAPTAIP